MRKCNKSDCSGFTLLEIILVIVIIGVIASAILPRIRFSLESPFTETLRRMMVVSRACQEEAILSSSTMRLTLNTQTNVFQIEKHAKSLLSEEVRMIDNSTEDEQKKIKEEKEKLLLKIEQIEKNANDRISPLSQGQAPIYYSARNILVSQKDVLVSNVWIKWVFDTIDVDTFPESMVFIASKPTEKERNQISIYFFSDGTV